MPLRLHVALVASLVLSAMPFAPLRAAGTVEPTCSNLLAGLGLNLELKGDFSAAELAELHRTFARLRELTRGLPVPEGLLVELSREASGASFDGVTIRAPLCLACQAAGARLSPEATRAVAAHEFGHAVFTGWMQSQLPDGPALARRQRWASRDRRLSEAMDGYREAMRRQGLIPENGEPIDLWARRVDETGNDKLSPDDIAEPLFQRWLALRRESDAWRKQQPQFDAAERKRMDFTEAVTRPYDELFGDCVGVLFAGDPTAMAPAALMAASPPSGASPRPGARAPDPKRLLARDFSRVHTASDEPRRAGESEPYALFAPTRHFLWKEIFSSPAWKGREPEVLERLLRAMTPEIRRRLDAGPDAKVSDKELNDRLIAGIRAEMAKPAP